MPTTALTRSTIHSAIDKVCATAGEEQKAWTFRRATAEDLKASVDRNLLFGLVVTPSSHSDEGTAVLTTFYVAYSTWDGRMLYLDQLGLEDGTDDLALVLRLVLSRLAVELGCQRFTWQSFHRFQCPDRLPQPEHLDGWLTLHWSSQDMYSYLGEESSVRNGFTADSNPRSIIEAVLGQEMQGEFRLRLATAEDVNDIGRLVQGLADFEKEPDAVHVTVDQYKHDGFATQPLFYCLLIETVDREKNAMYACGMAFCYVGVRLETGRFVYLEDLFIEKTYRGIGVGNLVMRALAQVGLALHCSRLVWQALDWNTPALAFYGKLGARVQEGLLTSRFAGQTLQDAAKASLTT